MMFGGRSMGGGGGGGSVFRTVSRAAVTRTVAGGPPIQEPLSSSSSSPATANTTTTTSTSRHTQKPSSSHNLSLSSPTSPFASCNNPLASNCGTPGWPSSPRLDDFDWVTVDNGISSEDDERVSHGFLDDFVLGPVPSKDEVHSAVSALQQVISPFIRDKFGSESDRAVDDQITSASAGFVHPASSAGSELDWMEPSAYLSNSSKMLQSYGSERVYDAFHLLQTESSVQRMVISLSSDRAVWDAVMNNEVVRELRESFYADEDNKSESPDENSDDNDKATNIVKWIFQNTLAKVMEAVEKITKVMGDLFQPPSRENTKAEPSNRFEDRLKTSFMLSVVVLLIVVVTRTHKA
ncbi:hypothetical protein ACFX13_001782 [Malus domestica]